MDALAIDLMRLFALALDLPERYFDSSVDRSISRLRVRNYPAPAETPEPGQLRAGAHSDYGSLTILKTEDRPGGLQVLGKDGAWLDVPHLPGCFVVNIGDMLARWTNDRWVSTLHRVVNPPPDRVAESRRQSVVFFQNPNYDAVVSCLPSCVDGANPAEISADHRRRPSAREIFKHAAGYRLRRLSRLGRDRDRAHRPPRRQRRIADRRRG